MSDTGTQRRTGVIVLAAVEASIGSARRWLAQLMTGECHGPEDDDAILILSELVTNAVQHAEGELVCHATLSPTAVEIAVSDFGSMRPVLQPRDPSRVGGVGLLITAELSTNWGVSEFAGGKTVWARVARHEGHLAPGPAR